MDTRRVFRRISNKMLEDFEISAEINHQGSKGSYRENSLKKFLSQGRLPARYSIGEGEIVGPIQNVSRQSDLIIYDKLNGFSLIYDEATQVYPIECVAGVIEVKSTLNKPEFLKALENIRSVKLLAPDETTDRAIAGGLRMAYKRPAPFGAVFGYRLGDNSLDSLVDNLRDWEKDVPKEHWPNVIAVLDEGLIYHYAEGLKVVYGNEALANAQLASCIHFRKDTLFKFYSAVIDLCANTNLGPVELSRYFDPAEQLGQFVVSNHDRITKQGEKAVYRLNERFIKIIVDACKQSGPMTHKELMIRRIGQVPEGMEPSQLEFEVYLYNPENLKGIHEVENAVKMIDGRAIAAEGVMEPCHYIIVDNETYYIPWFYVKDDDLEKIPGRTVDDL